MRREAMKTIGGLAVRREIDLRIEAARIETRIATLDECIAFLGGSGHLQAAEDLRVAAFEPQMPEAADV